jgi:hypothetical protein
VSIEYVDLIDYLGNPRPSVDDAERAVLAIASDDWGSRADG